MNALSINRPFQGINKEFTRSSLSQNYYYFHDADETSGLLKISNHHAVIYYIARIVSRLFGAHYITRSNVYRLLELGMHNIEHFQFSIESYLVSLHTIIDISKVLTELYGETLDVAERTKILRLMEQARDFSDIIMNKIFEVDPGIHQSEYWPEIMRSYCEIKFALDLVERAYPARNMQTLLKQFAKDGYRANYIKLKNGYYTQPKSLSEYFKVNLWASTEDEQKSLIATCLEKYKNREYNEQDAAIMVLVDQYGQNESGLFSTAFRLGDLLMDYGISNGLHKLSKKSDLYIINKNTATTISITKHMRFLDVSSILDEKLNNVKWFEIEVEVEFDKQKLRQIIDHPDEDITIQALKKHTIINVRWNPLLSEYRW